jgi:hypothetical protein
MTPAIVRLGKKRGQRPKPGNDPACGNDISNGSDAGADNAKLGGQGACENTEADRDDDDDAGDHRVLKGRNTSAIGRQRQPGLNFCSIIFIPFW